MKEWRTQYVYCCHGKDYEYEELPYFPFGKKRLLQYKLLPTLQQVF